MDYKIAFLDLYAGIKSTDNLIDAHVRNTIELAKYINCDLAITERQFDKILDNKYDVILLNYSTGYMPFKKLKYFTENNPEAQYIQILNEYNLQFSGTIMKQKKLLLITNFEKELYKTKNGTKKHVLNLNLLLSKPSNEISNKKYDCIYYGTFRPNRAKYFQKYLQSEIFLSTSDKNMKKYKHLGCNPKYIKKLSWHNGQETLNNFKYSLYIEDDFTHFSYNHLANRYYEAGFCNNVVFFDSNCMNTLERSELNYFIDQVKYYIVDDYKSLLKKIDECNNDWGKHLAIQKSWRLHEPIMKKNVIDEIYNIAHSKKVVENTIV